MKLSKRLETIASMVPKAPAGNCVADIGTDHGFVPIWLVENGIARRVLAMDVRERPLLRAMEHIRQYGMEAQIETRLSDGLDGLRPGEADTVVIAGMGGELMLRILRQGSHVRNDVKHWVLSPQSELSLFRHGLEQMGLAVIRETMVEEDGKYYTVMLAEQGIMHYDREYRYWYGHCLLQQNLPVLCQFLERERHKYQKILEPLEKQDSQAARLRCREIKQKLEKIREAYDEVQRIDGTAGGTGTAPACL